MTDLVNSLNGNTLAETGCCNLSFAEYKQVVFHDYYTPDIMRIFLRGSVAVTNNKRNIYNNFNLFVSLVNLAANMIDVNGRNQDSDFINEIIEWCKEYGLPYEDKYFMKNYTESDQTGYSGFCVSDFKRRIHVLHDLVQLWYGLTFNELDRTIKYSDILLKIDNRKNQTGQLIDLKKFLAVRISTEMSTNLELVYVQESDTYNLIPSNSNLLQVAYYQFSMLMINKGLKSLRFCSVCGKLFPVEHASKKICETCNKDYHRLKMQESRMKKGIEKKNKKESE